MIVFQSLDWVDVYSGVRPFVDGFAGQRMFQSLDWVDVYSGLADHPTVQVHDSVSIPRLG